MSRRVVGSLVAVLIVVAGASIALASAEVSPFARIFAYYQYNISGYPDWDARFSQNDFNSFEIGRIWMGLNLKTDYNVAGTLVIDAFNREQFQAVAINVVRDTEDADGDGDTTEIIDVTSSTSLTGQGRYMVYVREAFLQYKATDLFGVRFGLIPATWAMDATKAWAYRFVAAGPVDGTAKYAAADDFGIGFFGNYQKWVNYYFTVMNGEGFTSGEINKGKAFEIGIGTSPFQSIDLLKDFSFALYGRYNEEDLSAKDSKGNTMWDTRTVVGVLLSWKAKFNDDMSLNFGITGGYHIDSMLPATLATTAATLKENYDADYNYDDGATGYLASVWTIFNFYKGFGVFARYDMFDPNSRNDVSTADDYADDNNAYPADVIALTGAYDETAKLIAGVSYEYKNILVALDYQTTMYTAKVLNDKGDWTIKTPDSYIYVHTQISF